MQPAWGQFTWMAKEYELQMEKPRFHQMDWLQAGTSTQPQALLRYRVDHVEPPVMEPSPALPQPHPKINPPERDGLPTTKDGE